MIFRHVHDYEAVAVEHSGSGPFVPTGTAILWHCKCGHVFSDRIDGKWTLAQIRGERDLTPLVQGRVGDSHRGRTRAAGAEMMRQVYHDQCGGLLYIYLRELAEGEHVARTVEIDLSTMVDLDADGNLLGIEVLSPGTMWPLAEVLARWEVAPDDAAMLMACYPNRLTVQVA